MAHFRSLRALSALAAWHRGSAMVVHTYTQNH
jgi:hypothetical protein